MSDQGYPGRAFVQGAMDRLRPGWRRRAQLQRSWWKPIEVLLVIALWQAMWFGVWLHGLWPLHHVIHPTPQTFAELSQSGQANLLVLGSLALWPALLCVAGIIVNSLVWCVPPLRRLSERGSDQDESLTIPNTNQSLLRVGFWLTIVGLPLALLCAAAPF